MRKLSTVAALAILLAGCGARPAHQPAPIAPAAVTAPHGAAYRIDSSRSALRILVYRGGVMAAVGHNHVIVNRSVQGWVRFDGALSGGGFFLTVPVSGFIVDESAARLQEGAEFTEEIPAEARSGTLHNMLGPAVLDAQAHPVITVQSIAIEPAPEGPAPQGGQASVRVSVAGHDALLLVPFALDVAPRELHARGTFAVTQTALGLTPFSVLLGALRVEDALRVKFDLVAVPD